MGMKIRLARFGHTHLPYYRIRVCDRQAPRDGKYIEQVGTYNPIPDKTGIKDLRLNIDRIKYWITLGAQPTDTVMKLLSIANVVPPAPYRELPFKSLPKKTQKEVKVARKEFMKAKKPKA